jgi:hypothetical protein
MRTFDSIDYVVGGVRRTLMFDAPGAVGEVSIPEITKECARQWWHATEDKETAVRRGFRDIELILADGRRWTRQFRPVVTVKFDIRQAK